MGLPDQAAPAPVQAVGLAPLGVIIGDRLTRIAAAGVLAETDDAVVPVALAQEVEARRIAPRPVDELPLAVPPAAAGVGVETLVVAVRPIPPSTGPPAEQVEPAEPVGLEVGEAAEAL